MPNDKRFDPVAYRGVMVSSTFTDLTAHRKALIKVIDGQDLKAVVMENDSAKVMDVIESSLRMVAKASAYIGIISHKYGQVPAHPDRNRNGLSLTELEFDEALRLGRPILLFIMGPDHDVKPADVETDPDKMKKLASFRERAKLMAPDSSVHRVYKEFNNLHEFDVEATKAVAQLLRDLEETGVPSMGTPVESVESQPDPIPTPPTFYAEPPYIGSHQFVGREAQLQTLSDWASPADPHPVLLFEAIGGAGKSMLTWEWTTRHSTKIRQDWAGRFWYSFYEKGAVMADFCRRALAYMTQQPLEDFRKKKTLELSEQLLHHLQARPWLLVLDGLERVLVAYHRDDAARLADEEAGTSDQIANRDPCAAIRPEDDELLRSLSSASPSKLLLTSRLIPRVLLNPSSQTIPGVLRQPLPGLRPPDAEALLRSCNNIKGTSHEIQDYLSAHCDCHPLVIGVLAGLINDYLPDRGNFDAWSKASDGGVALNLANLDLIQKRNHILRASLDALPEKTRQLLSTLALLSEAVDYPTLSALNPHLPPEPKEMETPKHPETSWMWQRLSDEEKAQALQRYETALEQRKDYERAVAHRLESPEFVTATQELTKSVRDLERRGLLQYDAQSKRHDLHPVVRGIAAGGLRQEETDRYGRRVVDYFSQRTHSPYEEAETLDDVQDGLRVVRTLIQMGRHEEAHIAYQDGLAEALLINLEAHASVLALLRPYFPHGWGVLPKGFDERVGAYLASTAGYSLDYVEEWEEAIAASVAALRGSLSKGRWSSVCVEVFKISRSLDHQGRISAEERCHLLRLDLATLLESQEEIFLARFYLFVLLTRVGRVSDAEELWKLVDPMGRKWSRANYRPGMAEQALARFRFVRGELTDEQLAHAEKMAQAGRGRSVIRLLHGLRGEWQSKHSQWALAAESLHEAVRMAHEVEQSDPAAEAQLALANFHLDRLRDPCQKAEQLSRARNPSHIDLAALWLAIDDPEQAKKHALEGYKWAWADGEPYVRRYELNRARAMLEQLGAEIPDLRPYDPAKDPKFPWEDEVAAAIEKLRAENAAKAADVSKDE